MLRDNHTRARASGGVVRWTMAAGPTTVTFEIPNELMCAMANSGTVLQTFEAHRGELCAIAARKWMRSAARPTSMEIDARDLMVLLEAGASQSNVYPIAITTAGHQAAPVARP